MNSKAPAPSLNGHTERGLLFLLFCAMGCWLWRPIQHENDIFWHLASGRYMLENHRIPRLDVFSFTAAGHPWVNHEWLFQIPAFLAVRLAGISGIILLKILLILGAFYFISRRLSRNQIPLFLRWAVLALVFWGSR